MPPESTAASPPSGHGVNARTCCSPGASGVLGQALVDELCDDFGSPFRTTIRIFFPHNKNDAPTIMQQANRGPISSTQHPCVTSASQTRHPGVTAPHRPGPIITPLSHILPITILWALGGHRGSR